MGIILGKDLNKLCAPAFMCLPLFTFFVFLQSYLRGTVLPPPLCISVPWWLVQNLFITRRLQNTGER